MPTLPYDRVLNFAHAGTEIHFYECDKMSYLAYPEFADDTPVSSMDNWDDHHGYFCLETGEPVLGQIELPSII